MKPSSKKFIEWSIITVVAVLLAVSIRAFALEPRLVQMSSMFPTIEDGDYILVNKLAYLTHKPERSDIVVFEPTNTRRDDYIKRIVGLPGEWIRVEGGMITINGIELKENYNRTLVLPTNDLPDPNNPQNQVGRLLGEDEYFVLGDNASQSRDSRAFGPINFDQIVGKAFVVFMPIDSIKMLP